MICNDLSERRADTPKKLSNNPTVFTSGQAPKPTVGDGPG